MKTLISAIYALLVCAGMGCGVELEVDRGAAAGDAPVVELGGIKTCGTDDTPPCPLDLAPPLCGTPDTPACPVPPLCGTRDTPPCPLNPAR